MDNLQVQEYLAQGLVFSSQGKYEEALKYYDKAEKEDPMNIEVYLSKGTAYANLDQLDEAKAQFEKALKLNRSYGLVYFHLGSIAILQGDTALGFENFNKAIANGYDNAQLYYSIGLLHEENGDIEMAVRNYSKAITRDALRPDIRIRKARLLLQANRYPEAIQALDETILTNPDVFEGYHIKFLTLLELKQYDKAEEVLNTALELFPKDLGFAMDKVSLLIALGKEEDALKYLEELEQDSDATDALKRRIYMEKAQIYASEDNVDKSIELLEQAMKLSENSEEYDTEVAFLLATCYLSKNNYEKLLYYSREILEKAEDGYNKETARYYEPFALLKLGKTEEAMPKYKDAIDEFRRQSLEAPGHLDAYLLRIMCLRDIGDNEKALELADYVIALQPERAEPRMLHVTILEAMGRTEEAEAETKEVTAMLPEELRKK